MKKLTGLSVVFPAYNDAKTIPLLIRKVRTLLPTLTQDFEIIVVNDASSDSTASVLRNLKREIRNLRVITHVKNRGYGGALIHGFQEARKECIFYTDGDGQYDVGQLRDLAAVWGSTIDMVTGFRAKRSDPWFRKALGVLYNQFVKLVFGLSIRDVDCDFRLFRKSILKEMILTIQGGVFDAQFMRQCKIKRVRIKEIPVHHYSRPFGRSQFFTLHHLVQSLFDLSRLWARSFLP